MARKQDKPTREEWKAALVELVKEGDYLRTLVEEVVQQVLEGPPEFVFRDLFFLASVPSGKVRLPGGQISSNPWAHPKHRGGQVEVTVTREDWDITTALASLLSVIVYLLGALLKQ